MLSTTCTPATRSPSASSPTCSSARSATSAAARCSTRRSTTASTRSPTPPSRCATLFAEFETVPDWVDRDLVELGAAVWRRWGTMLFSVAGVITLEIYTEGAVAMPLSLAGGYAGDNALRRFLETCKFWIDASEPGALFEKGGRRSRTTAMQVRVMHVAVRKRVGEHAEWDAEAWGLPISQTYEQMTQIGGAVAPAISLWLLGYQTIAQGDAGADPLQPLHGPPARRAAASGRRPRSVSSSSRCSR